MYCILKLIINDIDFLMTNVVVKVLENKGGIFPSLRICILSYITLDERTDVNKLILRRVFKMATD